jgi:hypothetical protein
VGYSHVTVEGENLICMRNKRPAIDTSMMSEKEVTEKASFANQCPDFIEGTGLRTGYNLPEDEDQSEALLKECLSWRKIHPKLASEPYVSKIIARCVFQRIDK